MRYLRLGVGRNHRQRGRNGEGSRHSDGSGLLGDWVKVRLSVTAHSEVRVDLLRNDLVQELGEVVAQIQDEVIAPEVRGGGGGRHFRV